MYYMCLSFSDEPPKVTNHPKSLSKFVPGKPVTFTAEATGTNPLNYHWEWKPAEEVGVWQPCCAEWCDSATLTIPSVQKSNEGSYRCVISNYAGSQTSIPANLSVGKNPTILMCKATVIIYIYIYIYIVSSCRWISQNHHSATWCKECCPRKRCKVYYPSHWNTTPELPLAVEAN